jgi:predicted AAA+ superfamily ATPase
VDYQRRIVDEELDELLGALPAVALEGPKAVGKTATASRRTSSTFALDDPAVLQVVAADPTVIDDAVGTVLLDEWQRHPPVWDYVKRQVDAGAPAGRYLLTGSAVPSELPAHSGAGRIVQVRLRPLSLAERGLGASTVSFGRLLSGAAAKVHGTTTVGLRDYVEEIVRSGFPGMRSLRGRALRAQLEGYVTRVVQRDFPELGHHVRRPATLRAWLTAYAAATSTTASYNSILDASTAGETDKPAKTTTIAYRDVLSQLWLLDPVPGWVPGRGHLNKLAVGPKHHLADPALAAHLLGIDAAALLAGQVRGPAIPRDGTLLGSLFESLVTQSVRVYAQAHEATVHHLRTRDGLHEADLIVERRDQRVLALEVKLSPTVSDADVRHLLWLREKLGADLVDAAVLTTGQHAYRRDDGVAVIPAVLLGP